MANTFSIAEWNAYYTKKRIPQQLLQVHLLSRTESRKVLEIGPGYGLVTSLLVNLGYDVETLDALPRMFDYPDVPHRRRDIRGITGGDIAGRDAILCCEVLEHIDWQDVEGVLATFRASGARHLVVSVPYMGWQLSLDLYLNARQARHSFAMKKLLWLKEFRREPPGGHQWEIGYRGYSLKKWEAKLRASGWSILGRDFTEGCRSVFHLLAAG